MATKKNVSSGAEKAEKLTRKNSPSAQYETETKKKTKSATVKKTKTEGKVKPKKEKVKKAHKKPVKKMSEKRLARKKAYEEKKLARAKLRAEKKQARLEKKLEHKQKKAERVAAVKARKAELREKRRERKDMLKKESKEARRKRIAEERKAKREAVAAKRKAALAEKKAKREHRLKVRAQKQAERNEKRHAPGFGGWLAAVISLGVTTLALGTVLTFGWFTMNDMQADMAGVHVQSLYELNSVVDNLDADLSRAKASSSASDRVRVLSDIAIESQTAETILERLPFDIEMTEQMASFINKMSDSAKQMLYTVANGGELSASQIKSLEYMYETNSKIKAELNELIANVNGKDLLSAMRDKSSAIGDGFTTIQNNTFEAPKGIQDGPFADSVKKSNPLALMGQKEISAPDAEKLAKQYFNDYNVTDARCTGEATADALSLYNVMINTDDGEMLVQLSKLGGKVVSFDSFKDCSQNNFSVDRCIAIAEDFLASIGYEGLKPVWTSENGTTCNLNFAPVQNGAILYPDLVKVKVCEERGIVTGVEALSYVLNHGERNISGASISKAQAQSQINGGIEVETSRLALIPFDGGEILCYEFFGSMDGNEYYVYVDAATGEEIEVLTIIGTAQGKALM